MLISQISRILILIAMCLSLLIVIVPLVFNRQCFFLQSASSLFWFPFIVLATLLLYADLPNKLFFLSVVLLIPTLGILMMLSSRWNSAKHVPLSSGALLVISGVLLVLIGRALPPLVLKLVWFFPIIGTVAGILSILRLKRARQYSRSLLSAIVLLMLAQVAPIIPQPVSKIVICLLLMCGSYWFFLLYNYQCTYLVMQNRMAEANEKLSALDRSIDREVRKRTLEIERSNQRLLDISRIDALTNVYNKVNILSIINENLNIRNPQPFTILMFDIDNFKLINDQQGHFAGDVILKQIASTASKCIRNIDSLGRYGGDEFIIVLPGTSVDDALFIAERLRKTIHQSPSIGCTISIGMAAYPFDGKTTRGLINAADRGLYLSKEKGRNAVSYFAKDR